MFPAPLRRPGALVLAALLAGAAARAQPGPAGFMARILLPGDTSQFFCLRQDGGQGVPAGLAWSVLEGPGSIDPVTGRFTAGWVADATVVQVGLGHADRADARLRVQVLVLPHEPFAIVRRVLGPDWLQAHSGQLPYLDPETGARPQVPGGVQPDPSRWRSEPTRLTAGYGLPVTLRWNPPLAPWQRLSYREGEQTIRLDLDGPKARSVRFRGGVTGCALESLRRDPQGSWCSTRLEVPVTVRGCYPFAGNAVADPGHQDGTGLAARFRQPFGVARIHEPGSPGQPAWLVSDPENHVLRLVSGRGQVRTLGGRPGLAGHQDSQSWWRGWISDLLGRPRPAPLFNRPTHVAPRHPGQEAGLALVADSGNHVIRQVRTDGTVTTVAGTPGQAGHVDHDDPRRARFDSPQGLAADGFGNIYVADQGNCVIRVIRPDGRVATLAGGSRQPGTQDGRGHRARFTELRGLALVPSDNPWPDIYVADGHAVRRVRPLDGEVRTVIGQVAAAGGQDCLQAELHQRQAALGEPCLNRPVGLLPGLDCLYVADQGNHSVRIYTLGAERLTTLAGAPDQGEVRWGLLSEGLGVAPDRRFAALDGPRTLAPGPAGHGASMIVTTGPCLGESCEGGRSVDWLQLQDCQCGPATRNESCLALLDWRTHDSSGQETRRMLEFEVDFLNPDGSLAEHREGTARSGIPASVAGTFTESGEGAIVVRCVTEQGEAHGVRRAVEVREQSSGAGASRGGSELESKGEIRQSN